MINEAYVHGSNEALAELEKVAGTEFAEKVASRVEAAKKAVSGHFKGIANDLRMGTTGKMKIHSGKKKGKVSENMFVTKGPDKGRMKDSHADLLKAQGVDPKTKKGYLLRGLAKSSPYAAGAGAAGAGGAYAARD